MIIQGKVNAPTNVSGTDGVSYDVLQGKSQELIVSALHGKYFTQAYRGNVFIGTTAAAGVTPPIFSNASETFGIWNYAGSGVLAVPISCQIGYVSGTAAPGNFLYSYLTGMGSSLGTPITAFTAVNPVNAYLGAGNTAKVKFAPATITLSAAAAALTAIVKTMGVSQMTTTAASTTAPMWIAREDFDGMIVIPPNTLFMVASNVASATICDITLVWEEVPI